MFIITAKCDDSIIRICKELQYLENGYPLDVFRNTAYPIETTYVYEIDSISDDVEEYKHCYTPSNGFYLNKNYKEPSHTVTTEEYEQLASNVDYLMLIADPDSTSEESV